MAVGKAISMEEYKKNNPNVDRSVQSKSMYGGKLPVYEKKQTVQQTPRKNYSKYSTQQLIKMKQKTRSKMNKASGGDSNGDGKTSFGEMLKAMFTSAVKKDKSKEYNKYSSEYKQISDALDEKRLKETKYDKGIKGWAEKSSDVALSAAETSTKGIDTTVKKLTGKEVNEANYKPTLAQRQSAKIQSEAKGLSKIGYGLEDSIIRMIPAAMTGNPALGTAVSFANYGGSAYNDAREQGYTDEQATKYGVITGGLEVGLEKILGGMSKIYGKSVLGKASEKIMRKFITNPTVRETLSSMSGEFAEEYLQDVFDPIVRNIIFDEDNEISLFDKEKLYSGMMGALSAGLLEGGSNLQKNMNLNSEINVRVTEQEQTEGRKLSKSEKNKIKQEVYSEYENEMSALEKKYSTKEQIAKAKDKLVQIYENVTDNQNRAKIQDAMTKLQDVETRIEEKQRTVEDVKSDIKQDVSMDTIKNNFKTTDDYKKAGFMLSDGTMIDLSKNSNKRNQDHRIISKLYSENAQNKFKQADYNVDTSEGTSALIDFVKQGNIRMSPETNGLEIGKMPTDSQFQSIENYVKDNDGNVIIEYTTDNKTAPISQKYENGNANKIINDIKNHFNTISETKKSSDEVLKIKQDIQDKGISKWSQTALSTELLNNKETRKAIEDVDFSYLKTTNTKDWNNATKNYNNLGYDLAKEQNLSTIKSGNIKPTDVMMTCKLIEESQKKGDYQTTAEMLAELSPLASEYGQVIQALSMIKKLSPAGQLAVLQKNMDRLKKQNPKKYGELEIPKENVEKILSSNNSEELDTALDEAKIKVKEQVKGTVIDKLRAWRYFAMLGNPKTHIKNDISNASMWAVTKGKNIVRATGEDIFLRNSKNRTTTLKPTSKEVKTAINEYVTKNKNKFSGNQKYDFKSELDSAIKIFEGKNPISRFMQGYVDLSDKGLNVSDATFKSLTFKDTLGKFLTANGIKTKQDIENNPKLFESGVNYAFQQGLIATFNQDNAFAHLLSSISNKNTATKVIVEGTIPFKKVPQNVLTTGVKYSPIGLTDTLLRKSVKLAKGDITANQYIDDISQGLTGTGIFALGMLMASKGLLSGGDDDDKKDKNDKALGKQNYSLIFDGKSYTIDWLSPTSTPFLMGKAVYDVINKETDDPKGVFNSVSQPVIDTSYLDTIQASIEGAQYDGAYGLVTKPLQNFITQFFPTAGAQLAKTVDKTYRSTAASKTSKIPLMEGTVRQIMNKIPGATYLLEPQIDLYGKKVTSYNNIIGRFFYESMSPTKIKTIKNDNVTKELNKIYIKTKEDGVLPYISDSSLYKTLSSEKSAGTKEFTKAKEEYGNKLYDTLDLLFKTKTYKNSTDEEKTKLIKNVYTYAKDKMKQSFLNTKGIEYTNAKQNNKDVYKDNIIKTVIKEDLSIKDSQALINNPSNYHKKTLIAKNMDTYKTYNDKIEELRKKYYTESSNSKDIKNMQAQRKSAIINYINSLPLSIPQKAMMIKENYSSFRQYDNEIIQYVNSQNLSIDEKTKILKSVGFKVENGKVKLK